MRKFLLLILILCGINICFASDDIFNHPSTSKAISKQVPKMKDVSCKFTQEKYIGNTVLKSGGNFRFLSGKGAFFETLYPIKSSYSSSQNKQINDIMIAVSNGNYSYLNRNFDMFFKEENTLWTVGLKPKKGTAVSSQIQYIIIKGLNEINNIKIKSMKNETTDIYFKCTTN